MRTNDMLTGQRLCVCVEMETLFIFVQSNEMARQGQAPQPQSTRVFVRVTVSALLMITFFFFMQQLTVAETKMSHFGPFFELKIAFLVLALQRLVVPDHSMHVIALLRKLYQYICTASPQLCLFQLTWKSSKNGFENLELSPEQ